MRWSFHVVVEALAPKTVEDLLDDMVETIQEGGDWANVSEYKAVVFRRIP